MTSRVQGRLRRVAVAAMLFVIWSVATLPHVHAQSRIDRGPQYTYLVTSSATGQVRAPFLPLGWWDVGVCTPASDLHATNDAELLAHLDSLARYGSNLALMQDAADGRLVARRFWRAYPSARQIWFDVDGDGTGDYQRGFGHPQAEAYVERLRWFMDEAVARGIFTMIGVGRFIVPLPDEETDWRDNLAFVVDELKAHPGLFGWYLFDEPEVNGARTSGKGAIFGNQHDAYSGPSCRPQPDGTQVCQATTDLLREAYRVIKRYDADHVVAVSLNDPQHFYSRDRFEWAYTWPGFNGPFDIDPAGRVALPADVVGLNRNPFVREPPTQLYQHPNGILRAMEMVDEAVRRDGAWGSIYLSAQAQVADAEGRLPCSAGDNSPFRPLRDRDILWQMITPFIDGARGLLHYTHSLTPDPGTGASELARTQRQRIHRAMHEFRASGLDSMLLRYPEIPAGEEWTVDSLIVRQLTDDYQRPFAATGGVDRPESTWESPAGYVRSRYNRSDDGRSARMDRPGISMAGFRQLRTRVLRLSDASYLVLLSNAYDARIDVAMSLGRTDAGGGGTDVVGGAMAASADSSTVHRAAFDYSGERGFSWEPATVVMEPAGSAPGRTRLRVTLGPYEVHVYRVERGGGS